MSAKGKLKTSDYLPIDEYYRLLKCLRADKKYIWELYCSIAGCTALRVSDILRLKWIEILSDSKVVIKEKKTGNIRKINFSKKNYQKILELYKLMDEPDVFSYIIGNPESGQPYTSKHINHTLKRFKIDYQLKIKSFSTHSFRKTFGRNLYNSMPNRSEALILLMEIFKHSSPDITKRYIGLQDEEIQKAYNIIEL